MTPKAEGLETHYENQDLPRLTTLRTSGMVTTCIVGRLVRPVVLVGNNLRKEMEEPQGVIFNDCSIRQHLRGRDLTGLTDGERWSAGLNAAIIDEEFMRRYWPNEEPIGKKIRLPWSNDTARQPLLTVVRVVARVKLERLDEEGGFIQIYLPAL